jgi:hypothetical protein
MLVAIGTDCNYHTIMAPSILVFSYHCVIYDNYKHEEIFLMYIFTGRQDVTLRNIPTKFFLNGF